MMEEPHFSIFLILSLVYEYVASSSAPKIQGLRCSSTNVENYSCTWEIGADDNPNSYNVSYIDSLLNGDQVCPKLKRLLQDDKRLTCKFHKDLRGSVLCQTIEVHARSSNNRVSIKSIRFCPRNDARANPPVAIQFPSITSTSITVKWQKPNDVINYVKYLRYQLEYRTNTVRVWKKPPNLSEIDKKSILLTSLEEYTVYEIRMASKMAMAEWGPWSAISTAATIPGVPGIVSNMSAVSDSNALIMKWTIPSKPKGPINYYTVRSRFPEQGWFYQNTTNMWIQIPVDCNNVTEESVLTTSVAAVNIVNSSKLKGEWANRYFAVCDVPKLPTVLQNVDRPKDVTISWAVILVPSVVVLILIGTVIIKKYPRLDLSGSPNLQSRRYQFKRVCSPTIEIETFDELRPYPEDRKTLETIQTCACNITGAEGSYTRVACSDIKLANTSLDNSSQVDLPRKELDLVSKATGILKSTATPGDSFKSEISTSPSDAEYVYKQILNTGSHIFNSSATPDFESYTSHNFITEHLPNNDNILQKAAYLPHSTFAQTVNNIEMPPSKDTHTENEDVTTVTSRIDCKPKEYNEYIPHNKI